MREMNSGGFPVFETRTRALIRKPEVSLFRIDLSGPDPAPELCSKLGPREFERAERFATAELRRRYIWGRLIIKSVLASVSGYDLWGVDPVISKYGRPTYAGVDHDFNLSHSEDSGLIGVRTSPGRIGVDIEKFRLIGEDQTLSDLCFSKREQEEDKRSGLAPSRAFLRRWTCKEAVLKAEGVGLLDDMTRIEFTFPAPDQVQLVVNPFAHNFACTLLEELNGCIAAYAMLEQLH